MRLFSFFVCFVRAGRFYSSYVDIQQQHCHMATISATIFAIAVLVDAAAASPLGSNRLSGLSQFNIVHFGARADNETINTVAIQKAIDAAAGGGGIVVVPPGGAFKTGAISLRSNVYLFIPTGAVLRGSSEPGDYTSVSGDNWDRWDVLHTNNASNCGVIGDTGAGGILQGPMWQMISGFSPSQNQLQPIRWTNISGCIGECRPRLLVWEDCDNVTVANVQLRDSADWTQLYRRCNGVVVENTTVWGSQQWPNNDGCDFESCIDVVYRNVSR
jgi:polygalacturonase